MEIKEVEKQLEEAANDMELRPFSERWNEIKDEIQESEMQTQPEPQKTNRKKIPVKKWLPSVAAACLVFVGASIILPLAFDQATKGGDLYLPENDDVAQSDEDIYYEDNTSTFYTDPMPFEDVQKRMAAAAIPMVNVDGYMVIFAAVHISGEEYSKDIGYMLNYTDDLDNPNIDVVLRTWTKMQPTWQYTPTDCNKEQEMQHTIGETTMRYWLKSEMGGVYEYVIKAECGGIYYQIEHLGFEKDIIPFLTEFFNRL